MSSFDDLPEHRPTVLLVDDQAFVGEVVRRMLAREPDIVFHYLADPTQAIAVAARVRPTVILQDMVMPGVDGLTLVRAFRMEPPTKNVPLIVLSTQDEPVVKRDAFALGANDYVVKLPDPVELIARVRYHSSSYVRLLERDEAHRALEQRSTELARALSQLRAAEADLVASTRMASVANLVGGIAHELTNPVHFIDGNLPQLERYARFLLGVVTKLSDGQARTPEELEGVTRFSRNKDLAFVTRDLTSLVTDLGEGLRRVKLIVSDLQRLTKTRRGLEMVDLAKAADQTLKLLAAKLGTKTVTTDLAAVPAIPARAGELEQVLVNLVDNALRAIADDGHVRIRLALEGELIRLSVADDGVGMTEEVRRQACEPFFTTRLAGQGTGLGLAIVASIVHGHGGTLEIQSAPGKGTEMILRLPTTGATEPRPA